MINVMLRKKLIKKTFENIFLIKVPENDNNKFTCITHLVNVINHIIKLINNNKVAFITGNGIANKIINNKNKTNIEDKYGVYTN